MGKELIAEWMTPKEAAKWMERSQHTIYNWIMRTRQGLSDTPLELKRMIRKKDGKEGSGWMIRAASLVAMDANSPRCRQLRGNPGKRGEGGDSYHRVIADRRKWVQKWVTEGKKLPRILEVFNPNLHMEIRGYYEVAERNKNG